MSSSRKARGSRTPEQEGRKEALVERPIVTLTGAARVLLPHKTRRWLVLWSRSIQFADLVLRAAASSARRAKTCSNTKGRRGHQRRLAHASVSEQGWVWVWESANKETPRGSNVTPASASARRGQRRKRCEKNGSSEHRGCGVLKGGETQIDLSSNRLSSRPECLASRARDCPGGALARLVVSEPLAWDWLSRAAMVQWRRRRLGCGDFEQRVEAGNRGEGNYFHPNLQ